MPLQDRLGRNICLLALDAPVFQFLDRDRRASHRAAYEAAGAHHAEIAIEIFHLRFAAIRLGVIEAIEQGGLRENSAQG